MSRGRAPVRAVVALLLIALAVWVARRPLLDAAGRLLVAEDPPMTADVAVVSEARLAAGAMEAAHLYASGAVRQVLVPAWAPRAIEREVRALGVWVPSAVEIAQRILAHEGVPPAAIVVFGDGVDGTNAEVGAVARFVAEGHARSVVFLTARSHTRRVRWLLRETLPAGTRIAVRSPARDPFSPVGWWHDRGQTREVAAEYARWFNSFVLHDLWGRLDPRLPARSAGG